MFAFVLVPATDTLWKFVLLWWIVYGASATWRETKFILLVNCLLLYNLLPRKPPLSCQPRRGKPEMWTRKPSKPHVQISSFPRVKLRESIISTLLSNNPLWAIRVHIRRGTRSQDFSHGDINWKIKINLVASVAIR